MLGTLLALGGLAAVFDWPADGAPSDGEGAYLEAESARG